MPRKKEKWIIAPGVAKKKKNGRGTVRDWRKEWVPGVSKKGENQECNVKLGHNTPLRKEKTPDLEKGKGKKKGAD